MQKTILIILLIFSVLLAEGQVKKRGKVKRKYRQTEKIQTYQAPVYFRGKVRDEDKNLLVGVKVEIKELKKYVHTNEIGEFFFYNIGEGVTRIHYSLMGYETRSIDYHMKPGQNYHNVTLDEVQVHISPEITEIQNRKQQVLDIPVSLHVVNNEIINKTSMTNINELAHFIPGFQFAEQGASQPIFTIRGNTNNNWQPGISPKIATYIDDVPLSPQFMPFELFDIENLEVSKGPQNATFGNNSTFGAVQILTKKPGEELNGYLTAGYGMFNRQEIRGAVNVPIFEEKLSTRAAGYYLANDGNIENLSGGKLQGRNSFGGRWQSSYRPNIKLSFDLALNYFKEETSGTAFMSNIYPNLKGISDIYSYEASLNPTENPGTGKEVYGATLHVKYAQNEHFNWTSVSSYYRGNNYFNRDEDGTAAPALNYFRDEDIKQYFQEIRFNFSRKSKTNGFLGGNFKRTELQHNQGFLSNEGHLSRLFFNDLPLITNSGAVQPPFNPLPDFPVYSPIAGQYLNEDFKEVSITDRYENVAQAFLNIHHRWTNRINLSGGVQFAYNWFKMNNQNNLLSEWSTLGKLSGNSPNLMFSNAGIKSYKKSDINLNWRVGFEYMLNVHTNLFANYSYAARPKIHQFLPSSEVKKENKEKVTNYELGLKTVIAHKVFLNVTGFYQQIKNYQNIEWVAIPQNSIYTHEIINRGPTTNFGAEASVKASVSKWLDIFGNYTFLNATFDKDLSDTLNLGIGGNHLPFAPEHNFTAGAHLQFNIVPAIRVFLAPWYTYQTDVFFDLSNAENLKQAAYGVLNANTGLEFKEYGITLNIFGTNLLEEKYISSMGNRGNLFGLTTAIPGRQRMIGVKLSWKF